MSDLGNLSYFLGLDFKDTNEGVFLHQTKYAQDILKRFKMRNCNVVVTPLEIGAKLRKEINDDFLSATLYKQIIGSLRYLCNTKPYICQNVILLSIFMEKPQECHLTIIKRVLRYMKGMLDHGVLMPRNKKIDTNARIYGYTDSYLSGNQDENKSVAGYIFMIGGAPISWSSRKKNIVALSYCEAEYVDASHATCQTAWI
ncbi:secreted RxLR effector protein 161-like [Lathyrus oleraceus]|uniref:secreted RxLR effector protein 161-like n=1 Tax=Pisum sativum TaxID=3888 RepID=UPI0021D29E02|nr:secreted RxLR effector protein 161-like [Pisum sativum]